MSWINSNLGDVCDIINGKNQKMVLSENGKYPIYGSGGNIIGYANDYLCAEDTVIIGRKGNISKPILISEKFWNVDTAFGIFPKDKKMLPRFNYYQCLQIDFASYNKGTTIPSLVKTDLLKIPVYYPESLEEQHTIVAKLDQAFAVLDQAKNNIEKNIANAKELFQSKLNQIFSQKVDGWEEKKVKDIGKVQTGTTPPTKDKDNFGEFIPFIKPAHFNPDGSLSPLDSYLSEKGIKKSRLIEANSVLMVCIGATIGKTGFTEIDVTCNQQINTITPSKNYNYKFIYFGMISRIFQDNVLKNGKGAQATLPIINKSKWENLFLNVNPNKDVQQQIVNHLDQLQEQTNLLVTKYQQKLTNLEELKKSILEKAFKGELA